MWVYLERQHVRSYTETFRRNHPTPNRWNFVCSFDSFLRFHSLYLHANQSPHNSLFLKLYSECFHSNICRPLPWSSLLVCVFFPGLGRAFLAQKIGPSSYHMLQKCWTLVLMWGKQVWILTASLIFKKKKKSYHLLSLPKNVGGKTQKTPNNFK